jgi:hypothetical protein
MKKISIIIKNIGMKYCNTWEGNDYSACYKVGA